VDLGLEEAPSEIKAVATATGEKAVVYGRVQGRLGWGRPHVQQPKLAGHWFHVLSGDIPNADLILGQDFLVSQKVQLDCSSQTITIGAYRCDFTGKDLWKLPSAQVILNDTSPASRPSQVQEVVAVTPIGSGNLSQPPVVGRVAVTPQGGENSALHYSAGEGSREQPGANLEQTPPPRHQRIGSRKCQH
jgi:hypothetical protein